MKNGRKNARSSAPSKDFSDGDSKGGREGKFSGRSFGRRKVCPFIMDKSLVLDFKNIRVIKRFVTESGKIVPRHVSGVSAKNQRLLTKHIKRARQVGLIASKIDF